MAEKHYIDDLTNFSGTLNELKCIVDYLHDNYGSEVSVGLETEDDVSNVFLNMGEIH